MAFGEFNLAGKVALVTGGNSGIGLGMADGLARAGADVCIWGTNPDKNAAALKQLEAHGTRVLALKCNVADEAEVESSFQETLDKLGRVDSCFANAGVGSGSGLPFHQQPTDVWRRVWSVNLDGAFFTLRAASRHMVERGDGGRLIGTSSGSAIHGAARGEAYAATKGAMVALMQSLAVEFARYGVTSNTITPGWIETPMTQRNVGNEKFESAVIRRVPLRRWGDGHDFAGIAVYLASDASKYHTGDNFVIDGGYTRF
ncbi:MAG TPA: SDR family NAD(P)-dependent oxidoreductase [Tepidiformaceae bacterium]|nr:SDR family NAD(P)-dependent oxidoreductase [Tepidiformaceae bacterium]HNO66491.1 SDR family NAD(P)-dependent oxidoreductase [Tepidiformaceae bacterium]